jgi:hypothetical protein
MLRLRIASLDDLPLAERVELDIYALEDEAPVPMIAAAVALYRIKKVLDEDEETIGIISHDFIHANMRKIAYRPAGRVRAFLSNIQDRGHEYWQRYFTEFAKNVDYVVDE